MDRVKVGVIGCGYWGPNVVRNFVEVPASVIMHGPGYDAPGASVVRSADEALERLMAQTRRWGIEDRVRWLGETPDIHELLGLSDYVVMVNETAYAKMDYPLVVLESMSLGRPVLVGSGTPSAELAEEGGAMAVETKGEAVAAAIEDLASDEARRREVGNRGRELVTSKFSPREVAAAYELIYEELHA